MIRSFAFAATLVAAPVVAEPVSIETALGPATVATAPAAVAVYDMSALDMLDALKVGGLTSTNNTYLPYLKEYEGDIGTLHEPDFEALYVLNPDLVVAGGGGPRKRSKTWPGSRRPLTCLCGARMFCRRSKPA